MNTPTARRIATVVTAMAALAVLGSTSGCVAIVAGAGAGAAVAYVRGDLDSTLNGSLEKATAAVNKAIGQLQFAKVSENKDALQAIVIARNAADKRIEIRVEKLTDSSSKVKIRVGTFGDEALSLTILEKIKANL
jgi:hypothetical protein